VTAGSIPTGEQTGTRVSPDLVIPGLDPMGGKIAVWIAWHRHLFVMARLDRAMTETASREVANLAPMGLDPGIAWCEIRNQRTPE
jgi:hypothetical protein